MKNVKIIGLTGNIGSGKSTIARIFSQYGWPVFDSDAAGRKVLTSKSSSFFQVVSTFGENILDAEGEIDRKKLAALVFNDPEKIRQLNTIVHPAVKNMFDLWHSQQQTPFVIRETALLFETGIYQLSFRNIIVTCPLDERIRRVMLRNNTTLDQVLEREKNQWSEEKKKSLSDFTIENFEQPVLPQVMSIIQQLEQALRAQVVS